MLSLEFCAMKVSNVDLETSLPASRLARRSKLARPETGAILRASQRNSPRAISGGAAVQKVIELAEKGIDEFGNPLVAERVPAQLNAISTAQTETLSTFCRQRSARDNRHG